MFSITASLSKSSDNLYTVPTTATTGSDYYLLNIINIYKLLLQVQQQELAVIIR